MAKIWSSEQFAPVLVRIEMSHELFYSCVVFIGDRYYAGFSQAVAYPPEAIKTGHIFAIAMKWILDHNVFVGLKVLLLWPCNK